MAAAASKGAAILFEDHLETKDLFGEREKSRLGTILVVDDSDDRFFLMRRCFVRAGYENVHHVCDPRHTIEAIELFSPDVVVLDMHMPVMSGIEVISLIKAALHPDDFLPIIGISADTSQQLREKALSSGASDFIADAFEFNELRLRIGNLIRYRKLHQRDRERRKWLEEEVARRTDELALANKEILERLARAGEYRDDDTGEHTRRVGEMAQSIALMLGFSEREAEVVGQAALLHDIGKIGVSDAILFKPGKLTEDEFAQVRKHVHIGRKILAGSQSDVLKCAESIAFFHHERWDGNGYHKLRGEDIPIEARIVTVADVFDALCSERPYKKAWEPEDAEAEIVRHAGTQFDPTVVQAFLSLRSKAKKPKATRRRAVVHAPATSYVTGA